jgi:hypothetical protein
MSALQPNPKCALVGLREGFLFHEKDVNLVVGQPSHRCTTPSIRCQSTGQTILHDEGITFQEPYVNAHALDLVANGPTEAAAIADLIKQVRVYTEEIELYSRDSRRRSHLPLLLASTSYQRDEELARFLGFHARDTTRE